MQKYEFGIANSNALTVVHHEGSFCLALKSEQAIIGLCVAVTSADPTGEDHLRHTKFVQLRDDKNPRQVIRET